MTATAGLLDARVRRAPDARTCPHRRAAPDGDRPSTTSGALSRARTPPTASPAERLGNEPDATAPPAPPGSTAPPAPPGSTFVRIGKRIELEFDGETDLEQAREIADKLPANPVIEDFVVHLPETAEAEK